MTDLQRKAREAAIDHGMWLAPDALDKMIGGKLTEAPPSAELEILRTVREWRKGK